MAHVRFLPLLAILGALSLPLAVQGAPAAAMGVLRTLKVGGEGAWDYVSLDAAAGRLYVPRSTRVMVLDLSGKVLGEIPGTEGVHGVALAPGLDRGYTSNGRANTVTIFRLSTLKVEKVVPVGANPDAILFEPATRQVFVFNGRSRDITVLDAESGGVVATIPAGGKPEFAVCDGAAFDAEGGLAYASNGDGTLTVVRSGDAGAPAILGTFPTRKGARTLVVDGVTHLVYLPTAEFGPAPEPKAGQRVRPALVPGSFQILVFGETR